VLSDEPGFVQIPFWTALNYLEAVAKRAGELSSAQLAGKVLTIIRDVTNFRDPNGEARDNYHTYYKFAEMLGVLPLSVITNDDIRLAHVWLSSRFDHGLVGSALGKGLLSRLLAGGTPEDIERACLLMKECMGFRWLPEKNQRGRELVPNIDDYWLKKNRRQICQTTGGESWIAGDQNFLGRCARDLLRFATRLRKHAMATGHREQLTKYGLPRSREPLRGWYARCACRVD
jgi:hypothetical protein